MAPGRLDAHHRHSWLASDGLGGLCNAGLGNVFTDDVAEYGDRIGGACFTAMPNVSVLLNIVAPTGGQPPRPVVPISSLSTVLELTHPSNEGVGAFALAQAVMGRTSWRHGT
jgi:hypothetical protein